MSLKAGSKGELVRCLQENLKALELYHSVIDGDFGRRTRDAVILFQERYFVDGIADKHTLEAIEKGVIAWARRDLNILLPVPDGLKELESTFGIIGYEDVGAGYIRILNLWDEKNIEFADLPIVGRHQVHRKMVPVFEAVLEELIEKGLDGEILQFGSWCPRHKMHNLSNSLSTHSWGIACDINQATNLPGTPGDLDLGIVATFERYGFEWGGTWKFKDPQHFQYATGY